MADYIKIKRGLDIPLNGSPEARVIRDVVSHTVAVKPTDFRNLIPQLLVREGDKVLAGTPVFADKLRPGILFASPVSGTVSAVVRGDKRKLLEVRIDADPERQYLKTDAPKLEAMSREQVIDTLLKAGLWPCIQQRPYGIIANPSDTPRNIFISGFNTNPLAADYDYSMQNNFSSIQKGIDVLNKLLPGGVNFSLKAESQSSSPFHKLERVKFHFFDGPHPAGNVGVQINHIAPVNKGETVWCVDLVLVALIGRYFEKGIYDATRLVAVAGPCAKEAGYVKCVPGMAMKDIADLAAQDTVADHKDLDIRYISGSALTGKNVGIDGYLSFADTQVTFVSEGNYHEAFGWAKPFRSKHSVSHTYFSWLCPEKKYDMDTNKNGGPRAFVTTGEYRKVFPMDIYPVELLKACLAGDIDKMEQLGIYEVVEEDFALCEYICPSKIDIQSIITEGIATMLKEMA